MHAQYDEMGLDEYDAAVARRLRRRRLRAAAEALGCVFVVALAALAMVLWCLVTPDQMSAECDRARAELARAQEAGR